MYIYNIVRVVGGNVCKCKRICDIDINIIILKLKKKIRVMFKKVILVLNV